VHLKNECELTPEDTHGKDLCVSIGSDNTFLKTAMMMRSLNHPSAIFGINSSPRFQQSKLCDVKMNFENHEDHLRMIVDCLEHAGTKQESLYLEYINRKRIELALLRYHGLCSIED
jgi:hypothetical protein